MKKALHKYFKQKKPVQSHNFRKTKATDLMIHEGWNLLQVSKYLGHSSIATT
jgi:integrase